MPLLATSPFLSVPHHQVKHCAKVEGRRLARAPAPGDPFGGRINSGLPGSDAAFLPVVFPFLPPDTEGKASRRGGVERSWGNDPAPLNALGLG